MSVPQFMAKGTFVEVEINRNVLFYGASNANSRTLKVKIKNHDYNPHTYHLLLNAGKGNWSLTGPWFVVQSVAVNPGDVVEVGLDLANGTDQIPNYQLRGQGFYVFVDDNNIDPDVYIPLIWTFDVNADQNKIAQINFNKWVKYSIYGGKIYTRPEKQTVTYVFFILDTGDTDYIPVSTSIGTIDTGIIIAINPFDREAAVVDIRSITSQGYGQYLVELQPVPTGYVKVDAEVVVDYGVLGNWLGSAFAWITKLGTDAASVFLNNKVIQYLVARHVNPLASRYLGVQNVTVNAYQDPNDPAKVHIVVTTFYNVLDDPGVPIFFLVALAIALILGSAAALQWSSSLAKEADVKKIEADNAFKLRRECLDRIADPKLSLVEKQLVAGVCGFSFSGVSQLTGASACEGPIIGNTCIPWWIPAAAVGALFLLMLLLRR